jgi:fibronectin-binding autotransporter adhesin
LKSQVAGSGTSFTGVIKGTGVGISWLGDGRVSLSGANTYTGATNIAAYVDLAADARPNLPGPLGNASSDVLLDRFLFATSGNVATLNLQPGVTMARNLDTADATLTSSGGTSFVTGTVTLRLGLHVNVGAGGVMHLAGTIMQGGGTTFWPIDFNGAGTTVVDGNILSGVGPLLVNSGRLLYNGPNTVSSSGGGISVSTGELGGTGSTPGPLTIGDGSGTGDAILAPGDGIGTLHSRGVTLASDAVFKFELNSTAGTYDLLSANGAVQLGSAILSISDLGSTALPLGFQFALIENTSSSATTGTFQGLAEGATVLVGSNLFAVSYDTVLDGDGMINDVVLKVVPEPAGGALLGVGALIAGLARRRNSRR